MLKSYRIKFASLLLLTVLPLGCATRNDDAKNVEFPQGAGQEGDWGGIETNHLGTILGTYQGMLTKAGLSQSFSLNVKKGGTYGSFEFKSQGSAIGDVNFSGNLTTAGYYNLCDPWFSVIKYSFSSNIIDGSTAPQVNGGSRFSLELHSYLRLMGQCPGAWDWADPSLAGDLDTNQSRLYFLDCRFNGPICSNELPIQVIFSSKN